MSWTGMDLVIRIKAELKAYRDGLREAARDTQVTMAQAKASTDGLTAAQRALDAQAGSTAKSLVAAGRAAAAGDFATAGQQAATMASGMNTAGAAAGGLGTMLGVAAAAVGTYLVVSYKAAAEFERQANLLALTGNAAGLVGGDMNRMAGRVAEAGNTTVGSAREITEALVATGKVGRPALESVGTAIALVSRASGQSQEQVTADFARMADGVAKWAAEHNERYHFLTLDQYKYIKALEDAGNQQQAMKVVGEAFIGHLQDIDKNVGYLQGAWRGVAQWASKAWDAMMNWGRAETTQDKLATVTARVNELREQVDYQRGRGATGAAEQAEKLLKVWQQQQTELSKRLLLEERSADAQADRAAATVAAIAEEQKDEKAKRSSTAASHAQTEAERAAAQALRERIAAAQSNNAAFDEEFRRIEDARLATEGRIKSAREMLESIERETQLMTMSNDERERAVLLWDLERKGVVAGTEAYDAYIKKIDKALARRKGVRDEQAAKTAGDQLRADELKAWEKTWEQVSQSFTDSLMQGGKSVKDYLTGLFRTLVLRPVLAPVGGAMASMVSGGGALAGQASGAGGGASGLMGTLGQVSTVASALGTGMAASFTSMVSAGVSGWATAAGSLIGSGSMAGIAAGLGMVAAPLLAAAVLWKPLFGRTLKSSRLEGTFSGADGLSASTSQFYEGGWFRSDKTVRSAMDAGAASALQQQYAAVTAQSNDMARALGKGAAALAGFTHSFSFSTKGLSDEQLGQRVAQELAAVAEAQARVLIHGYERAGESSVQALQRLSSSLVGVNVVLDRVGQRTLKLANYGAHAASALADLFGGMQAFASASGAYVDAIYSDEQKLQALQAQLTKGLGAVGLAVPQTRAQFKALVEAQDLYTDSGRAAYAALVQLAPVFDAVTSAAEEAAQAQAQAAQEAAQAAQEAAQELADTFERLGVSIAQEVQRLRGAAAQQGGDAGVAALQAQFALSTAAARAGDTDALERLPQLSQAVEAAAADQVRTAQELVSLRLFLAESMGQTMQALGLEVPALATGTNFVPQDMLAMLHEGEAVVPRAFNPAAGGAAPGSAGVDSSGVAAFVQELRGLRAEVRSGVEHGAKTARILDRVARDGNAFVITPASE